MSSKVNDNLGKSGSSTILPQIKGSHSNQANDYETQDQMSGNQRYNKVQIEDKLKMKQPQTHQTSPREEYGSQEKQKSFINQSNKKNVVKSEYNKSVISKNGIIYDRSKQYSHRQMEGILKPEVDQNKSHKRNQNNKSVHIDQDLDCDMYTTETKQQFASFDREKERNLRDLKIKAEVTNTRRLIETYNAVSLQKAVGQQIMSNRNQLRDNVEKYINQKSSGYKGGAVDETSNFEYEWTPCRYNNLGWKYIAKGATQNHLNHPNKRNSIGYTNSVGDYSHILSDTTSLKLRSDISSNMESLSPQKINLSNVPFSNQKSFQSNYNLNFPNKADLGKQVNTMNASSLLKQLDMKREYEDAPLPNIQGARLAFLKNLKDQQSKIDLHEKVKDEQVNQEQLLNQQSSSADLTNAQNFDGMQSMKSLSMKVSPERNMHSKVSTTRLVNQTLDGIFDNSIVEQNNEEENPFRVWAGQKLRQNSNDGFGKKKSRVTNWQAAYYQGGLFQYIK
eukprot:403369808